MAHGDEKKKRKKKKKSGSSSRGDGDGHGHRKHRHRRREGGEEQPNAANDQDQGNHEEHRLDEDDEGLDIGSFPAPAHPSEEAGQEGEGEGDGSMFPRDYEQDEHADHQVAGEHHRVLPSRHQQQQEEREEEREEEEEEEDREEGEGRVERVEEEEGEEEEEEEEGEGPGDSVEERLRKAHHDYPQLKALRMFDHERGNRGGEAQQHDQRRQEEEDEEEEEEEEDDEEDEEEGRNVIPDHVGKLHTGLSPRSTNALQHANALITRATRQVTVALGDVIHQDFESDLVSLADEIPPLWEAELAGIVEEAKRGVRACADDAMADLLEGLAGLVGEQDDDLVSMAAASEVGVDQMNEISEETASLLEDFAQSLSLAGTDLSSSLLSLSGSPPALASIHALLDTAGDLAQATRAIAAEFGASVREATHEVRVLAQTHRDGRRYAANVLVRERFKQQHAALDTGVRRACDEARGGVVGGKAKGAGELHQRERARVQEMEVELQAMVGRELKKLQGWVGSEMDQLAGKVRNELNKALGAEAARGWSGQVKQAVVGPPQALASGMPTAHRALNTQCTKLVHQALKAMDRAHQVVCDQITSLQASLLAALTAGVRDWDNDALAKATLPQQAGGDEDEEDDAYEDLLDGLPQGARDYRGRRDKPQDAGNANRGEGEEDSNEEEDREEEEEEEDNDDDRLYTNELESLSGGESSDVDDVHVSSRSNASLIRSLEQLRADMHSKHGDVRRVHAAWREMFDQCRVLRYEVEAEIDEFWAKHGNNAGVLSAENRDQADPPEVEERLAKIFLQTRSMQGKPVIQVLSQHMDLLSTSRLMQLREKQDLSTSLAILQQLAVDQQKLCQSRLSDLRRSHHSLRTDHRNVIHALKDCKRGLQSHVDLPQLSSAILESGEGEEDMERELRGVLGTCREVKSDVQETHRAKEARMQVLEEEAREHRLYLVRVLRQYSGALQLSAAHCASLQLREDTLVSGGRSVSSATERNGERRVQQYYDQRFNNFTPRPGTTPRSLHEEREQEQGEEEEDEEDDEDEGEGRRGAPVKGAPGKRPHGAGVWSSEEESDGEDVGEGIDLGRGPALPARVPVAGDSESEGGSNGSGQQAKGRKRVGIGKTEVVGREGSRRTPSHGRAVGKAPRQKQTGFQAMLQSLKGGMLFDRDDTFKPSHILSAPGHGEREEPIPSPHHAKKSKSRGLASLRSTLQLKGAKKK